MFLWFPSLTEKFCDSPLKESMMTYFHILTLHHSWFPSDLMPCKSFWLINNLTPSQHYCGLSSSTTVRWFTQIKICCERNVYFVFPTDCQPPPLIYLIHNFTFWRLLSSVILAQIVKLSFLPSCRFCHHYFQNFFSYVCEYYFSSLFFWNCFDYLVARLCFVIFWILINSFIHSFICSFLMGYSENWISIFINTTVFHYK